MRRIFTVKIMQAFRFFMINAILYYDVVVGAGLGTVTAGPSTGLGSDAFTQQPKGALVNGNGTLAVGPSSVSFGKSTLPGQKTANNNLQMSPKVRDVKTQAWNNPFNQGPVNGDEKPWNFMFVDWLKQLDVLKHLDWLNPNPDQKNDFEQLDDTFKNIYKYTLNLLMLGMRKWMDGRVNSGSYLGYDATTINLIDRAMTELFAKKRKSKLMGNLLETYYYSCDVANVGDGVATVKETFRNLLDRHSWMTIENATEEQLVRDLKSSLNSVTDKVKSELSVTIPLMKNRMFIDPTESEAVNRLQKTVVVVDGEERTFRQIALSCSKSTTGIEVTSNHLNMLYLMIPTMFRYAYENVYLLLDLYDICAELSDEDEETLRSFSTYMDRFTSMLVERYFEFRWESDPNLMNQLKRMSAFFNPKTKYDEEMPNMFNYKTHVTTETTAYYKSYVQKLTDETLFKLVGSFNYDVQGIEEKMKNYRVSLETESRKTLTKKSYMNSITERFDEGSDILDEYSKYYVGKHT